MRRFAVTLLCLVALSACGGDTPPPELPFSDSTASATADVAETPSDRLDPLIEANYDLVLFRARWVCELQRRTFTELADMDTALNEALAETNLTRDDYEAFLQELAESQALRDGVLTLYEERCQA